MFSAVINTARCRQHSTVFSQFCCRLKHGSNSLSIAPGRKSRSRSAVSKYEDPDEIRAHFEEAENMQDWMQSNEHDQSQAAEFVNREAAKMKQVVIRKIIERKYFKSPQETNLLTWAAKEQIRYLHAEFPNEWTVERIATSFPISEHGVKKILCSKCTLKSAEEILKHDQRVQKHWLALQQGARIEGNDTVTTPGGPLLLGGGKYNSSSFIAGDKLVQSKTAAGMLTSGSKGEMFGDGNNRREASGLFELIVKDYCEKTRKRNVTSSEDDTIKEKDENVALDFPYNEQNRKLASGTIGSSRNVNLEELRSQFKSMSPVTRISKDTKPFGLSRNDLKSLLNVNYDEERKKDNIENRRTRSREDDDGEFHVGRFIDGEFDERVGANEKSAYRLARTRSSLRGKRRGLAGGGRRRRSAEGEEIIPAQEVELYAMKGTGKILESGRSVYIKKREKEDRRENQNRFSSESSDHENYSDDEKSEMMEERSSFEKNESFERDRRQDSNSRIEVSERNSYITASAKIYDQIRYDFPGPAARGKSSDEGVEAYLYDSEKGYSHPFGRPSDHPEPRVDVKGVRSTGQRSGGATYKKGNAYYDEDGELLFRTP